MLTHPRVPSFWFFVCKLFSSWIWLKYCLLYLKQSINQFSYYWKERWNKWIQKKEIQKKRKRQKEERIPVSPPYHGIFMLKSNVDTSIELDTIMCANWLMDAYTTGSSRLDPGFHGVRVVHICVFWSSCMALPIVCPSMIICNIYIV
jgi:hypothetical protein